MGNLIQWPPYRAAQVADIQNAVFAYGKNIINTDLYQGTLDQLEKMAEILESQEEEFYIRLNVKDLQELQFRIDSANSDPGFAAMTAGSIGSQDDKITNQDLVRAGISWGEANQVFEMAFEDNALLSEAMEALQVDSIAENTMVEILQKVAPEEAIRINRSLGDIKRGFSKRFGNLTLLRDSKTGKVRVQVTLKERLSNNWKKRLEHDYNILFDKLPTQADNIREWLNKNIVNAELKNYVLYQFDNNLDKFALNRSKAGVQGFLGEVKANAFFNYITKNHNTTIPTGVMINTKKKEIPIDAVVNGFGFQVKNYVITDGEVNFNYKQGADSFVESRMAAEQPLSDILIAFFGSYTYNKPVTGADEYESQIYERFRKALDGSNSRITDILDLYLDDIIKVSSIFSTPQSNIFANEKRWYNTFFLIGSHLVPSSAIVWAIRGELERKIQDRQYIRTHYEFEDTDNTKVDIENNDMSEQGEIKLPVWPGNNGTIPENMRKTANRVKISADITLNIPLILSNALKRVK